MAVSMRRRSEKTGLSPGTSVHVSERPASPTRISVIDYNADALIEKELRTVEECLSFRDKRTVTWLCIDGLGDVPLLDSLGKAFGLHPLVVEDILQTEQRPKMEVHEDHLYIVLRMLDYDEKTAAVRSEQVSIVLGKDYLISFREAPGSLFDPILARIRSGGKGRIRRSGPDYLAYALMDTVVDHYFAILEKIGERVEKMETELIANPTPKTLRQLFLLKRDMIAIRKAVWPLREVVSAMEREENAPLIGKSTRIFLRDVYDHTIQAIDTIETDRDILSGMVDIYLSSLSNKLNEVMKLLTVIGTIFMPLTFITGIYGMNFEYMPELAHPFGYFSALAVMLAVSLLMLMYFRMKKWL